MNITIIVTTRFEGFHCWPAAPDEVAFLRSVHRHTFTVKAELKVTHDDRDQEFFMFRRLLDDKIEELKSDGAIVSWSCERWALELTRHFKLASCEVWEDDENGARVTANW